MRYFECFKNPSLTIAKQHPLYQKFIMGGSIDKPEEQEVTKRVVCSDLTFKNIFSQELGTVITLSWVSIHEIEYKQDKCFVMVDYIKALR